MKQSAGKTLSLNQTGGNSFLLLCSTQMELDDILSTYRQAGEREQFTTEVHEMAQH